MSPLHRLLSLAAVLLSIGVFAQGIPAPPYSVNIRTLPTVEVRAEDGGTLPVVFPTPPIVEVRAEDPDAGLVVFLQGQAKPIDTEVRSPISIATGQTVWVVGPSGGPVETSLDSQTQFNLGAQRCAYVDHDKFFLQATPTILPPLLPDGGYPYMPGRTEFTFKNLDPTKSAACFIDGDGGTVGCTAGTKGTIYFANGGGETLSLINQDAKVICIACSAGGALVHFREGSCGLP